MEKMSPKQLLLDYLIIAFGGACMALAVNLFYDPYQIVPGGVTGIAMMLNFTFPQIPIGTAILVMNIPLFLVGWRVLGHQFLVRSLIGTLSSALIIDALSFLPFPKVDTLAAAIMGGILGGAGMGLVFSRGATTGGSDILARLLKVAFPSTQMGVLMMLVDGCVVLSSTFVFGSLNNGFYAVAGVFAAMHVTDAILYGLNVQWTVHIITEHTKEVNQAIQSKLDRGTTILTAEGGYTGEPRKVILTAVGRQQISTLKRLVKETDPAAFIIVNKAYEVLGEGFRKYDKNRV